VKKEEEGERGRGGEGESPLSAEQIGERVMGQERRLTTMERRGVTRH
jgi:hypothetical protein